ncbi:MAG: hypothetical protein K6D38_09190 [Pseudobutyrivibrio sp.]|nr:hypothetical protein [Pseudobutyrivibrio sp.]
MDLKINDNEYTNHINIMLNALDGIENAAKNAIEVTNDLIENYFVADKVDKAIYSKLKLIENFIENLKNEYADCQAEVTTFLDDIDANDARLRG